MFAVWVDFFRIKNGRRKRSLKGKSGGSDKTRKVSNRD
jgi:hypothetical protein